MREPTLEELRAECRKRGMTGFSNLKKADLLRRMEGMYAMSGAGRSRRKSILSGAQMIRY